LTKHTTRNHLTKLLHKNKIILATFPALNQCLVLEHTKFF